jgi:lysophospholipase
MTITLPPEPVVYEVPYFSKLKTLVLISEQITPLEFGSYDPNLSAMVNITYAGTHLTNGQPPNSTACVTGFDEAGFVMGTSASLFNVGPFLCFSMK